jgi:hypothetical protein
MNGLRLIIKQIYSAFELKDSNGTRGFFSFIVYTNENDILYVSLFIHHTAEKKYFHVRQYILSNERRQKIFYSKNAYCTI